MSDQETLMGAMPSPAVSTDITKPALSGTGTVATTPAPDDADTSSVGFGMPHALVITVCIVTAAVLAPPDMGIRDVLALLAGAGGIGATIVVVVMTGGRRAGRIGRLVRAYFSSGS
ncbi:hypothetical protein AB0G81_25320 [Streptomyces asoensis]|uniref:hypothetical protein n=1 Tax=Streptomyces asoensis TaxID=249586 RepID=UPI0033D3FAF8